MNQSLLHQALMGVRKNGGRTIKPLGHTNNGIKLLGLTHNAGTKVSHSKTKM